MKKLFSLFLIIIGVVSFSFGTDFSKINEILRTHGDILEVKGKTVYISLGEDKVRPNEIFDVKEKSGGILSPLNSIIGNESYKTVGKIKIIEVHKNYSVGEIIEGSSVHKGDKAYLYAPSVCFEGSEESFYELAGTVAIAQKGKDCPIIVKEFEKGFGISYRGQPIGFIPKESETNINTASLKPSDIRDLHIIVTSKLVKSLGTIPLSATIGDFYGNGKDYLAVLTHSRLIVYQVLKGDLTEISSMDLPAGTPISVSSGKIGNSKQSYIIVNMFSGEEPNSFIAKMVGDSIVKVAKDIPYIMAVLNKNKPISTFYGQEFTASKQWGTTYLLGLKDDKVMKIMPVNVPAGFTIDSASIYKNYLIFIDRSSRVRVFKNGREIYSSEEGYGGSYTFVNIPFVNNTSLKFVFNPKGAPSNIVGIPVFLVPKNKRSSIEKFFGITKYSYGELAALFMPKKDVIELKTLRGATFEEAIQAIVTTKDGKVFILTGSTGTIPFQNNGDIYEVSFRVL